MRRAIESLAGNGENRLVASSRIINGRKVDEAELREIDLELHSLFNVNTPEDYQLALKLAGFSS